MPECGQDLPTALHYRVVQVEESLRELQQHFRAGLESTMLLVKDLNCSVTLGYQDCVRMAWSSWSSLFDGLQKSLNSLQQGLSKVDTISNKACEGLCALGTAFQQLATRADVSEARLDALAGLNNSEHSDWPSEAEWAQLCADAPVLSPFAPINALKRPLSSPSPSPPAAVPSSSVLPPSASSSRPSAALNHDGVMDRFDSFS